jgi:hypothetical protein
MRVELHKVFSISFDGLPWLYDLMELESRVQVGGKQNSGFNKFIFGWTKNMNNSYRRIIS